MQNSKTIRMLWIDEIEFDVSSHKTRLVEMITNLQQDCDVRLLTAIAMSESSPKRFKTKYCIEKKSTYPVSSV